MKADQKGKIRVMLGLTPGCARALRMAFVSQDFKGASEYLEAMFRQGVFASDPGFQTESPAPAFPVVRPPMLPAPAEPVTAVEPDPDATLENRKMTLEEINAEVQLRRGAPTYVEDHEDGTD